MALASRLMTAFAAVLALMLASGVAAAEDADGMTPEAKAQFDRRLFGHEPAAEANTYACFVRHYDAAHLTRHPHQKVTMMKLLVTSEWMAEDNTLIPNFRLGVRFRDKKGEYESSGGCDHFHPEGAKDETRLGCGVDCDGGGIGIAMGADDKSVTVRLDRVRIWQKNKSDEDAAGELVAGKDDGIFRLDRVSLDVCRSLIPDGKELAALHSNR